MEGRFIVMDCWAMVADGGRSMRKWREILRPGWVARLKFVIMASDASKSELVIVGGSSYK